VVLKGVFVVEGGARKKKDDQSINAIKDKHTLDATHLGEYWGHENVEEWVQVLRQSGQFPVWTKWRIYRRRNEASELHGTCAIRNDPHICKYISTTIPTTGVSLRGMDGLSNSNLFAKRKIYVMKKQSSSS